MTYQTLTKLLTSLGADAPTHEAAEMIRVLTGHTREWCLCNPNNELPPSVDAAAAKRKLGMPLQYILGEAWFYGRRFIVSPDCLIPQPDTEHCVALALKYLTKSGHLLDLCTGSGCIAISILKETDSTDAVAIDISPAALEIAKQNSKLHDLTDRLTLTEGDVLSSHITAYIENADVIVSNPPYISSDVIATLSAEVLHEPRLALDGGDDGMIFYRHLILNLSKYMKPSAVMILEIGYDQSERILELCRTANLNCKLHRDFGGNIRNAVITRHRSN